MTPSKIKAPVVPLAYRRMDAATALDMGPEAFDEHVRPEIGRVRRGAIVLYPVTELKRWLEANTERSL